ncbi:MAG TPA: hypothetical protein VNM67_20125 [Thermoanaerobaculia bacterium]|jgi:hypothetical protein|nr:hypothetical protein [Thermoanaerobaculia bacterium]
MKKKTPKKLVLSRETLRNLHNQRDLANVHGGWTYGTCKSYDFPCDDYPVTVEHCGGNETIEHC